MQPELAAWNLDLLKMVQGEKSVLINHIDLLRLLLFISVAEVIS